MRRLYTFTFRLNRHERRLLVLVARYLSRTESDAVRWLIGTAAREFGVVLHPTDTTTAGARLSIVDPDRYEHGLNADERSAGHRPSAGGSRA